MATIQALRIDCGRLGLGPFEPTMDEFQDALSCDSGSTTPGEDIWTKFEMEDSLYPTPPVSPENKMNTNLSLTFDDGASNLFGCPSNFASDLSSMMLGLDSFDDGQVSWNPEERIPLNTESAHKTNSHSHHTDTSKFKAVNTSLIQDCMWSAFQKLLQKDTEKVKANNVKVDCDNVYSDCSQPSDCVDPTAVFPYPLSITETHLDLSMAGTTTPSDSEEEIDVVTIATIESSDDSQKEKKSSSKQAHHRHKRRDEWSVSSSPEHDYAKPGPRHNIFKAGKSLKRSRVGVSMSHSHSKRRKSSGVNPEEVKKALQSLDSRSRNSSMYNPASSRGSSKASSRCSSHTSSHSASDSEECDKRVNHNVLERKRREDLRSAFFRLRDRIPELESKERASKVVILEKSRTFVQGLRKEEERLALQKRDLEKRHRDLVIRLRQLRTFCK